VELVNAESNEMNFRRFFRCALDTEVEPALSALGFEIEGKGGYSLRRNDGFDFATNIRESKGNRFGAEKFDVLFSIWMIESGEDRRVRGIWLPIPLNGDSSPRKQCSLSATDFWSVGSFSILASG